MLNQQNDNGSNEDKGEERSIQLVIVGKHPTKALEFLEKTLNQINDPCKYANPPAMDSEH